MDYNGTVITELNTSNVESAIEQFKKENVTSIAICFMNSFANGEHEQKTAEIVRQNLPDSYLTVSNTFLPSIRFYDRVSSTVLNSYIGPILTHYLTSLKKKLADIDFGGILLIMQSNGGVISPERAIDTAAATLLSGPAGGPVAGIEYTGIQGYNDCITVDMGGTSFDAALIKNKTPLITTEGEINRFRLALPMLNIVTIGAGVAGRKAPKYARSHEKGGTIRPKTAKALTIPLPGIKGVAANYPDAFIIKSKKGNTLLVESRGTKGLRPLFVLKKSVKMPARHWLSQSKNEMKPDLQKLMKPETIVKIMAAMKG